MYYASFWTGNLHLPLKRKVSSEALYQTTLSYVSSLGQNSAAFVASVSDDDVLPSSLNLLQGDSDFPAVPSLDDIVGSSCVEIF